YELTAGEVPPERKRELDGHLGVYPPCAALVETYRATVLLARRLPPIPMPPEALARLRQALTQGLGGPARAPGPAPGAAAGRGAGGVNWVGMRVRPGPCAPDRRATAMSDAVGTAVLSVAACGCPAAVDHDRNVPEVDLLSPLTVRGVTFRNRVVMSPMC